MDDPRDYFRMWSAPVYRWLSACVQRPILKAMRARRSRTSSGPGQSQNVADRAKREKKGGWPWILSVMSVFAVSSVMHEASAYVAMRRTFWPISTFFLVLAGSVITSYDVLFPPRKSPAEKTAAAAIMGQAGSESRASGRVDASKGGDGKRNSHLVAAESRGWLAIAFNVPTGMVLTLAMHYLTWQWWRHAVMDT